MRCSKAYRMLWARGPQISCNCWPLIIQDSAALTPGWHAGCPPAPEHPERQAKLVATPASLTARRLPERARGDFTVESRTTLLPIGETCIQARTCAEVPLMSKGVLTIRMHWGASAGYVPVYSPEPPHLGK